MYLSCLAFNTFFVYNYNPNDTTAWREREVASHKVAALFTYYIYSGTSIKRTPLGTSLLAVIERWSSLGGFDCQLCIFYESFLAANES